jgi:hypothetical protein
MIKNNKKMSQDFSKAKIYKITNDDNHDIYIGSTCNTLNKRFSQHKCRTKTEDRKDYPLYKLMNDIGCNRFRIELLENFPCNDKYELSQREGKWIREIGTLNSRIAGRTATQYQEEHKEYYQEIKKKSAIKHKEENIIRKQQFYIDNKERILQKQKERYEKNKDEINAKRREQYAQKKLLSINS